MADNKVQIIIEAIDKTQGALKGVAGYFNDLQNNFDKITRSPALQFLKDAIDYTDKYATKVQEFSGFTGLSVEETSRLIGAASNFGIEYDTLMKGMENALKNGREITVEELGNIANEYVAIGKSDGPVGQAKLLVDTFGQAGLGLGALFAEGAVGVEGAMADIDASLALDEGEMNKIKAYKEATGEFNEALGGLKTTVAIELMPTLSSFFTELGKIISKFEEFDVKWRLFYIKVTTLGGVSLWSQGSDRFSEKFLAPEIKFAESLSDYQQYRDYMDEILGIADLMVDGYGAIRTKTGEIIEGVTLMTEEEWKAYEAAKSLANTLGGISNQKNIMINVDAHFTENALTAMDLFGHGGGGRARDLALQGNSPQQIRAYGGPVQAHVPYIVGEKGPELIIPQNAGRVVPNNQLQGGADFDYARLGDEIVGAMMRSGLVR